MQKPTVHLNGTPRASLYNQFCDAVQALHAAMEVVSKAAPNGRDYYLQGDDAIHKAGEEHRSRLNRLDAVRREFIELIESVME